MPEAIHLSVAAPTPVGGAEFGFISCPPGTSLFSGIAGFVIFSLLAFVVPYHMGLVCAKRRQGFSLPGHRGALTGALLAAPAIVGALVFLRHAYSTSSLVAWAATVTYTLAALSFVSAYRSAFFEPPRLAPYASLALGFGSILLFVLGWPVTVALALSLLISAALARPFRREAKLPPTRTYLTFAVIVGFADLLMVLGDGPTVIGRW